MKKIIKITTLLSLSLAASNAHAYYPILRDYRSTRAEGMGDVRYTTGLYTENLFANPARGTENPNWRIQLPEESVEASGAAISSISSIIKLVGGNNNGLSTFADSVGKPLSARIQNVFPGYFYSGDWSFGVVIVATAQTIAEVSQTGIIDPTTFVAVGPVVNIAHKMLEDRLSVGANAHLEFRGNSQPPVGVDQYLTGANVWDIHNSASSLGYDFDLGTTFKPHWGLGGMEYELAFAVNNILGGGYRNISSHVIDSWNGSLYDHHLSYNAGISATHKQLFFFDSVLFALEFTDFGVNQGSIYRSIHLGTEWKWGMLAARAGVSQGYITGGFGLDAGFFTANIATYAEELGLNAGDVEDRRYAIQLGFQI